MKLLLSGVKSHLAEDFVYYGVDKKVGKDNIHPHIDAALAHAAKIVAAS